MPTRRAHTRKTFLDRDVLHVMGVATFACVATGGLLYAYYFGRVVRTAVRAPIEPAHHDCMLVFGKHSPEGQMDLDFKVRLDRAAEVMRAQPPELVFLLGGGPPGTPSEAEVARNGLQSRGITPHAGFHLEDQSRDTLQNLRNARELMRAQSIQTPVVLLSSRYHLARCLQFARQLGFKAEPCAAESRFEFSLRNLQRMAGEAAYICLADIGTRWARFIRNDRMLARVT